MGSPQDCATAADGHIWFREQRRNLAVPAGILAIDKVPVLGSGKTNYVAATALAKERVGGDQKVA